MTIKQLPEVVNGRVKASVEKVDASLIDLAPTGNAIVATTEGLKVDLSGYATSTELTSAFDEITAGVPLLVDTKVNAAIASVVDSAPATFDTLKEIADWIETEGVNTTDLAASIAGKADKSELDEFRNEAEINTLIETYVMETYNPQLGSNITLLLDNKVDKIEGKGLSTNDYTDADKAKVDGIDTSISTAVNAAITVVVDNAPTTFDTLREIAEWIENDGVAATDLASAIAGKADRTELSDYATVVAMTQLEGQVSDGLSNKVDKEAGKGLSTNDFTDELKEKLIYSKTSYVDRHHDSISVVHVEEEEDSVNFLIETPGVERQMQIKPKEFMSRSTVNSVPLYSLDNDGKFVLTEPDSWVSFGESSFVFPVYHLSTVDNTYLKGIVTLSAELGDDGENNPTIDFNYTHNVKDVIDGYVLYVNIMALTLDEKVFPHTFTSSVEGDTVSGTIKVPLTYSASGFSFQQAIDLQETNGFVLRFGLTLKSGDKRTVEVSAFGTTPEEIV